MTERPVPAAPRAAEGARRQHPLRHLPRAGPRARCRWPPREIADSLACTRTPCAPTSSACATSACSRSPPTRRAPSAARSTATRSRPTPRRSGFEPPAFPVLARMLLRLAATAGLPAADAVEAGRDQGAAAAAQSDRAGTCARGPHRRAGRARASTRRGRPTTRRHHRLHPLPVPRAGRGQPRPRVRPAPRPGRGLRRRAAATARSLAFHDLADRTPCQVEIAADRPGSLSTSLFRSLQEDPPVITLTDTAATQGQGPHRGRGRAEPRPAGRRAPRRLLGLQLRDVLRHRRRRRRQPRRLLRCAGRGRRRRAPSSSRAPRSTTRTASRAPGSPSRTPTPSAPAAAASPSAELACACEHHHRRGRRRRHDGSAAWLAASPTSTTGRAARPASVVDHRLID